MRVDATSYDQARRQIIAWAQAGESRCICVGNVHMTMESYDAGDFRKIVNSADLVTPDGMPLVWLLRRLGVTHQERVAGAELLPRICEEAAHRGISVGFYGTTPETLAALICHLGERFPGLKVAYAKSPAFRPLSAKEDEAIVKQINNSGCRILFVGLGCPKQERWMAGHKGRVKAVMLGVGAAFDFHAGKVRRAPAWMQRLGLEWAFRFATEPRRLWKRYLKHNPRFVWHIARQVLNERGPSPFSHGK